MQAFHRVGSNLTACGRGRIAVEVGSMPLIAGAGKAAVSQNIRELANGKRQLKQRIAIALSEARKSGSKIAKPPKIGMGSYS